LRSVTQTELPPGPRLPTPAQTLAFWRWPLGYLELCRRRYGSRFTVRTTGYPPFVFVSDPQDLKVIFNAPAEALHAGEGGMTLEPLIGESSFMLCDEEEHLAGRRAVLPAFHGQVVQRHAEEIGALARRAVASWPRDRPIALHGRLHALTLEIILSAIFGAGGDERLRALAERLLAMLSITASVVLPEQFLRHGPGARIWKRFLRERAECDELIFALLEERSGCGGGCGGGWVPHTTSEPGGLLARLLAASNPDGSPMSRRQLRDNIVTAIVSGHETTASELEWAFQLLAHNPAVLRRLLDEVDGDAGDEYLTATVNEVLRHRPAFLFMIPRAVKRPIELGGWIRGPAQLLGCTYLTHHDPALYPEPHRFRPERFLEAQPAPQVWLPWGGGRRRCPGRHMAMLEMKAVLRTVLSSVTVHPAARRMEHPRWRSVVVTPHAGSRVVLRSRKAHS
jgi:cytochrome P450